MSGGGHADGGAEFAQGAGAADEVGVAVAAAEAELVARAVDGDAGAVAEVVRRLQDPLYRLALRMVSMPADAEDAVQEIMIRVITRLSTWRGEAKLLTWAYRVGVNYLLNLRRRSPQERQQVSLDDFRADLADGLAAEDYRGPEATVMAEEVRLGCTQAMLQCLSRDERVAFVLGDLFDLKAADAAWILDISPAAFQKRAERAKHRLATFMRSTCGLADPKAFCHCPRRVEKAIALGRVDPARPAFTAHPITPTGRTIAEAAAEMLRLDDAAAILRAHPDYAAPQAKMDAITGLLHSGRFPILD
ncbi:RNA polymerase sigma factor [Nocardia sp. NPDC052566]|uniref:RNA polymerase sigma factor n=1 Tax=Nocardia sp. NPDC052566 TaxID=3364330 RepID=UPI0037C9B34B